MRHVLFMLMAAAAAACSPRTPVTDGGPLPDDAPVALHVASASPQDDRFAAAHMHQMVLVDAGGRRGSGVVVGNGEVLTAMHVVDGSITATVSALAWREPEPPGDPRFGMPRQKYEELLDFPAYVVTASRRHDVALLRADGMAFPADPPPMFADELAVGSHVLLLGRTSNVSSGFVSAVNVRSKAEKWPVSGTIRAEIELWYGDSGGPLYDSFGNLVGICLAIAGDDASGHFLPIGTALLATGLLPDVGPPPPPKEPEE